GDFQKKFDNYDNVQDEVRNFLDKLNIFEDVEPQSHQTDADLLAVDAFLYRLNAKKLFYTRSLPDSFGIYLTSSTQDKWNIKGCLMMNHVKMNLTVKSGGIEDLLIVLWATFLALDVAVEHPCLKMIGAIVNKEKENLSNDLLELSQKLRYFIS
ncbi:unnamed protein product, partial [Didymodactylos carnosus]